MIFTLLTHYPERMEILATVLPYVTMVKRVASLLALFIPLARLVFLAGGRLRPIPQNV